MATFRSPTWILREPRIGPAVTVSSVRAGTSPIVRLLFLPPVLTGSGSMGPALRRRSQPQLQRLPREGSSLGREKAARHRRRAASADRRREAYFLRCAPWTAWRSPALIVPSPLLSTALNVASSPLISAARVGACCCAAAGAAALGAGVGAAVARAGAPAPIVAISASKT